MHSHVSGHESPFISYKYLQFGRESLLFRAENERIEHVVMINMLLVFPPASQDQSIPVLKKICADPLGGILFPSDFPPPMNQRRGAEIATQRSKELPTLVYKCSTMDQFSSCRSHANLSATILASSPSRCTDRQRSTFELDEKLPMTWPSLSVFDRDLRLQSASAWTERLAIAPGCKYI
jgi:hypothetical protein